MEDKVSYIAENDNLKPCPWCGTTLGYYTGKYLQGTTHKFYKFTHFTSRCNMTIETEWCPSKEKCDGMWNDRVLGFFCNQSKKGEEVTRDARIVGPCSQGQKRVTPTRFHEEVWDERMYDS